jgi:MarR family 2-MHQ and catechol resistance regulon transcriptional repressor
MHIPGHIIAQLLSYLTLMKLVLAKQYSLNTFQFLALLLVGNKKGTTIKGLKRELSLPGSSLTFIIDSLEKKRLIRRRRSKEDRRQWLLFLTAKGKRLYMEILEAEGEMIRPALENLSETEKATFLKIAEEVIKTRTTK